MIGALVVHVHSMMHWMDNRTRPLLAPYPCTATMYRTAPFSTRGPGRYTRDHKPSPRTSSFFAMHRRCMQSTPVYTLNCVSNDDPNVDNVMREMGGLTTNRNQIAMPVDGDAMQSCRDGSIPFVPVARSIISLQPDACAWLQRCPSVQVSVKRNGPLRFAYPWRYTQYVPARGGTRMICDDKTPSSTSSFHARHDQLPWSQLGDRNKNTCVSNDEPNVFISRRLTNGETVNVNHTPRYCDGTEEHRSRVEVCGSAESVLPDTFHDSGTHGSVMADPHSSLGICGDTDTEGIGLLIILSNTTNAAPSPTEDIPYDIHMWPLMPQPLPQLFRMSHAWRPSSQPTTTTA